MSLADVEDDMALLAAVQALGEAGVGGRSWKERGDFLGIVAAEPEPYPGQHSTAHTEKHLQNDTSTELHAYLTLLIR